MAHVILLGHSKREQQIREQLAHNFHVLTTFPSVPDGIQSMNHLQPDVVMVAENTSASARENIAEKVQKIAPDARFIFLYEHFIDSAQFADAIVDTKGDPSYLIAAIDYVYIHQGSIWKSAVSAA